MPMRLPAGPYRKIRLSDGTEIPYYIVPFDKRGICEGPETRKHLLECAHSGGFTDIFLFAHGWNNDWSMATGRYEAFIDGYMKLRQEHALPVPAGYRPLLVGIFWPSTALVFGAAETGPEIAAEDPAAIDAAVSAGRQEVAEIAAALLPERVARFYELVQKDALTDEEGLEMATILQPLYNSSSAGLADPVNPANAALAARPASDEVEGSGGPGEPTPLEILGAWKAAAAPPEDFSDPTDFGTAGGGASGPRAAGIGDLLRGLDPRQVIRVATVWQMKDRAGVVGAGGVGPLLRDLLDASSGRIHLIGHSYGAKVVLSAAASAALPRKVDSILLLQPAVSHLCFAAKVPGSGRPGGYRQVLDRVEKPILSTFSARDFPLTRIFHLAVRRAGDLGEAARIAAAGEPEPPSRFAALGGFGPRGAGEQLIDIQDLPQRYDLASGTRVYGLRATRTISGHGDINNASTWWALYNLAS